MAATDFVTESQVDSLTTTIAAAVKADIDALAAHIAAASGAHAASTISLADAGALITATEVEAALQEIVTNLNTASASIPATAADIPFVDVAGDYTASDVEAALAEVRVVADAAAGGGVAINDGITNTTDAWSSQKISDEITAAVAALIDGAPGALDTLNELAAAINDDAVFTTTVTTALSLRVRVDAAQAFTGPQQDQGKANLGIASSTQNFAGDFTTGIA